MEIEDDPLGSEAGDYEVKSQLNPILILTKQFNFKSALPQDEEFGHERAALEMEVRDLEARGA